MTPSDLDEIRKRCEGPGCVECGTPDSATDDAKALLDEVERLNKYIAHNDDEYRAMKNVLRAEHQACQELRSAAERLQRENGAHRALAMLEPKEMSYADRFEFERLKRADIEQGKRVAELTARLALLEPVWEAAKEWRQDNGAPHDKRCPDVRCRLARAIDAAAAKEGK